MGAALDAQGASEGTLRSGALDQRSDRRIGCLGGKEALPLPAQGSEKRSSEGRSPQCRRLVRATVARHRPCPARGRLIALLYVVARGNAHRGISPLDDKDSRSRHQPAGSASWTMTLDAKRLAAVGLRAYLEFPYPCVMNESLDWFSCFVANVRAAWTCARKNIYFMARHLDVRLLLDLWRLRPMASAPIDEKPGCFGSLRLSSAFFARGLS